MSERPSEEVLRTVAQHGQGTLTRALAIVLLARRYGREDELRRLLDANPPESWTGSKD